MVPELRAPGACSPSGAPVGGWPQAAGRRGMAVEVVVGGGWLGGNRRLLSKGKADN